MAANGGKARWTTGAVCMLMVLCAAVAGRHTVFAAGGTTSETDIAENINGKAGDKKPPPPTAYAGDGACSPCHKQQAATYTRTAHYHTSSLASAGTIEGNFSKGSNVLQTANPNLAFVMSEVDGGFVQSAVDTTNPAHVRAFTEPFDIVVGSGRKAHSYLYWQADDLFELPVSYWAQTHQWINSPGFPDGDVHFDREVVPRCLDCHGSYFESQAPPINRYLKSSLVLGITCEKCHGPGLEHVTRERSTAPPPRGSSQQAIVNPARLSRERQLDSCSLCHAGPAVPIAPVLSYLPGEPIDRYLKIPDPGPDEAVDVHGNQVQLLRRSRCFRSSAMTCTTCHDVHRQQRDVAEFSERCLTCHKAEACGKFHAMGESIRGKCVSCHMPLGESQVLFSNTGGQRLRPLVRSHRIAIYPEAKLP